MCVHVCVRVRMHVRACVHVRVHCPSGNVCLGSKLNPLKYLFLDLGSKSAVRFVSPACVKGYLKSISIRFKISTWFEVSLFKTPVQFISSAHVKAYFDSRLARFKISAFFVVNMFNTPVSLEISPYKISV